MSLSINGDKPPCVYEDSSLLVIDKPAGWVVNRSRSARGKTVQDWIDATVDRVLSSGEVSTDILQEFSTRSGIVHRLDKETSGLLIIAKDPEAFLHLKTQFQNRSIQKEYVALVHGKLPSQSGIVNAPVGRLPWDRQLFGVIPQGKEALTRYQVKTVYQRHSLLSLTPSSGRTHQIRVHMKYLGHPVVSDPQYGGRKQLREDLVFCPRLFLHAQRLLLTHPVTRQRLVLETALPADLTAALTKLIPL